LGQTDWAELVGRLIHDEFREGVSVKLQAVLISAAAFAALAACTPAAETPAPVAPAPADIAAATPESGPAAENTTETLASAPVDATAAPAPAATATPTTAAAPPAAPAAPAAAAGPTKLQLANGAAVYARTCAMCHGPTGAGTQMGVGLTAGHEFAVIKEKVTKGPINPGDKMPPLAASMSADDLSDVAHYIEAGLPPT